MSDAERCPRCGSDDPCGLAIGCDVHQHPFHDKADQKRREVKELEELMERTKEGK